MCIEVPALLLLLTSLARNPGPLDAIHNIHPERPSVTACHFRWSHALASHQLASLYLHRPNTASHGASGSPYRFYRNIVGSQLYNSADIKSCSTSATSSKPSSSPPVVAGGLSTGAKAGIGAGVRGGVLVAAALGICWYLATRRHRRSQTIETQQSPPQYPQVPSIAPYQQAPPGGVTWVPVPSGTVPFYMQPGIPNKDGSAASLHHAPAYSPPRVQGQ